MSAINSIRRWSLRILSPVLQVIDWLSNVGVELGEVEVVPGALEVPLSDCYPPLSAIENALMPHNRIGFEMECMCFTCRNNQRMPNH